MKTVVVSVGTDHHPFNRMLDWIADAQRHVGIDVFVQRGATDSRPGLLNTVAYLPAPELGAKMATADAVVCHGGPGTIAMARDAGHRPIVLARDPAFDEHVDDHQIRYVASLNAAGVIDVAQSAEHLVELLSADRPLVSTDAHGAPSAAPREFANLVERFLAGEVPKRQLRHRFVLRRQP